MGQHRIFQKIARSICDQVEGNLHRERPFITGEAGKGKTFLFNLLKNQVFQQPESMAPPTHLWQLFTLVQLVENMRNTEIQCLSIY